MRDPRTPEEILEWSDEDIEEWYRERGFNLSTLAGRMKARLMETVRRHYEFGEEE